MMSVYGTDDEVLPEPDVIAQMYQDVDAYNETLKAQGAWVFGGGLHPADTATVVKIEDGDVLLTDGPFVEAKEKLGGFWIIEAADLDAAVALASKASVACRAPVEVRPFQDS
jgi:hypothetical protein